MKKPTVTCVTISENPIKRNLASVPYVNRVAELNNQTSLMLQTYRALELVNTKFFFMTNGEVDSSPFSVHACEGLIYGNSQCVRTGELVTINNQRWSKANYLNGNIVIKSPLIKTSKAKAIIRQLPLTEIDFLFALHYFVAVIFGAKYSPNTVAKIKESLTTDPSRIEDTPLRATTRDWIIASEYKIRESIEHA